MYQLKGGNYMKENVYKKIYEDFCNYIKEEQKSSFLFFDNDGCVILGKWEELEEKHLGSIPKREYQTCKHISE